MPRGQADTPDVPPDDVFRTDLIAALGHTIPTRWVRVPEWGNRQVCMWGTTQGDELRIAQDARLGLEFGTEQAAAKRQIATIIDCARDGAGPDAQRIFDRLKHWGWLEKQPTSVLDSLYNAVQELNMSSGIRAEQILDFFAIVGSLQTCLTRISSVCACCTDCPANCRPNCPRQLFASLLLPTAPSPSENTPTSATTA